MDTFDDEVDLEVLEGLALEAQPNAAPEDGPKIDGGPAEPEVTTNGESKSPVAGQSFYDPRADQTGPSGDEPKIENQESKIESGLAGEVRDALKMLGDDLGKRVDSLRSTFERELRAEASRERVIDRLHSELQEYKQDLLLKVQKPIFIDLIQLHDDIGKMIESKACQAESGEAPAGSRAVLESIQTAIEDILYRQGVEPFSIEGAEFDPRRQRAVSTLPTEEPALNKTVAARLRKGFQAGDKLIRPEMVTVFTLRQSQAPATS